MAPTTRPSRLWLIDAASIELFNPFGGNVSGNVVAANFIGTGLRAVASPNATGIAIGSLRAERSPSR